MTLEPYPAYKSTGAPWLKQIPAQWSMAAVKRHYAIQLGKMLQNQSAGLRDVQVPYLKAQHVQWFAVRTSNAPIMWASPRDIEQFSISSGDLLVCEGGEGGRCGMVKDITGTYIIQNALHRVRPRYHNRNDYLQYVMSAVAGTGWFDAINNKATIAHFTSDKFGNLKLPTPSPEEQSAIVRFLDHAVRRVRRYINAKRRLIALLNEQKQAIINQAVTRGVAPDVALKPSGVNWLGAIPAHWQISRSKRLFTVRKELARPGDVQLSATQAFGVIPQSEFEDRVGRRVVKISMHLEKRRHVEKDDFVISMRSFQGGLERAWASGAIRSSYVVLKPGPEINVDFFSFLLKTPSYIRALQGTADFIRDGQDLNYSNFCGVDLPVVPLGEQQAIAQHIAEAIYRIEAGISRSHREIAILNEYQTRLIADVVTGKLDVRQAATNLPDELGVEVLADEALPMEDEEALLDETEEVADDGEE